MGVTLAAKYAKGAVPALKEMVEGFEPFDIDIKYGDACRGLTQLLESLTLTTIEQVDAIYKAKPATKNPYTKDALNSPAPLLDVQHTQYCGDSVDIAGEDSNVRLKELFDQVKPTLDKKLKDISKRHANKTKADLNALPEDAQKFVRATVLLEQFVADWIDTKRYDAVYKQVSERAQGYVKQYNKSKSRAAHETAADRSQFLDDILSQARDGITKSARGR